MRYQKLKKRTKWKSCLGRLVEFPAIENGKEITDRREFGEDWGEGLVGWNIEERALEEKVGDRHEMDNREEEKQAGNEIGRSQLECLQYKLTRGNGWYSSVRTKQIIEREMPGARKGARKKKLKTVMGIPQGV